MQKSIKNIWIRFPAAIIAVLAIAYFAQATLAAPNEAELSRQVSADSHAALEHRDAASLLRLVRGMKELACLRGEVTVCQNFGSFEKAGTPELKPGNTILLGPSSVGTSMRKGSFGACLFKNSAAQTVVGTCFDFGVESHAELKEVETVVAQQQSGKIDDQLGVFKFLDAQLNQLPLQPVSSSSLGMEIVNYKSDHEPEASDGTKKRPMIALLRQSGSTFYVVNLGFLEERPGSFDTYPTLTLTKLHVLK